VASTTSRQDLAVGSKAPDVALVNVDGKPVHLSDYIGKGPIVLYFYPKDNTTGCTMEACAFRDSYAAFTDAGVEVIGVSKDSPESHRDFAARQRLPFVLLTDKDGSATKTYGAETAFGLIRGRVTFVIDREGIIRHRFSDMMNAPQHVKEALAMLPSLA
jgi:peroxiredoxin Q/BCP